MKITGRYLLVRKLGRGGMGAVFLVEDTHRSSEKLALKRVQGDRLGKKAAAILRNEFTALASLDHPNLARVYDFGIDRETADYFFTSEFVDGVNLLKACRDLDLSRADDLAIFFDLLAQVLRALEYIHSRGLVHGDIKPENILVTGLSDGSVPRLKLIDFGLTKREKEFGGKKVIGTTYYIAPETITGAQVDRRTDLYSLGAVLYQLITGKPPFVAESHATILKCHVEEVPAHPITLRPRLPAGLGEIVLKLLEKRPTDRYQGALSVLEALNAAFGLDIPFETQQTSASYLYCAQLVSRETEMRTICSAFQSSCRPDAVERDADLDIPATPVVQRLTSADQESPRRLHLLRGEKGIGKRRLSQEMKKLVQTQGAHFISVECSQRSRSNSNEDFLQLMQEFVAIARVSSEKPRVLLRTASLFKDDESTLPVTEDIATLFEDLALYILRLTRHQPLAIHFHDFHRGGKLLLSFVSALLGCHVENRVPTSRILLTASALDRIDCESTDLHELLLTPLFRKAIHEICLSRLDSEAVGRLLSSLFTGNDFPASFVSRVYEESDGNPGVLREICEFFLARKLLRRTIGGWSIAGDFDAEPIPGRVRLELRKRIEGLPAGALRLAVAFSVLGDSTPLDLAVKLANVPRERVLECMQCLYRGKVLREDSSGNQINVYSFVHATARDILYNLIPEAERAVFHDRAGALCEEYYRAQRKKNPERIAIHFLEAGNREQGIRHGLEAAEALSKALYPARALAILSDVLRLAEGDPPLTRRIRFEIARLQNSVGRYNEALDILVALEAAGAEGGMPSRSQLLVEVAFSAAKVGRLRAAARYLDKAYAVESAQVISGWMVHVLLGFGDLHYSIGRHEECLRSCEKVLKLRNEIHDTKLLCRLYHLLAESSFAMDQRENALKYCQDALLVADSRSEVELFEASLFFMGLAAKYKGKLSAALRSFELCASLRKKRGALAAEAEVLLHMGIIENLLWRPRRAVERLEAALLLFEKCDDFIKIVESLNHLGEARRLLGEYEDSKKAVTESLRRGKNLGLRAEARRSYFICGKICVDRGDLESAERYFAEAAAEDAPSGLLQDPMGGMLFHRGDFTAALEVLSRGLEHGKRARNKLRAIYFLEDRIFLHCYLGKHAEARPLLVSVFDLVKRYDLRVHEGRAHLLQGVIHAREGGWERSKKSFQSALEILKEEGSERDLVVLYLEKAQVHFQIGEMEEAFLCLDEGLYLAKKLNLLYWKCRIQYTTGLLESTIEEGNLRKADECLRIAEKYAVQGGYVDLLWQIQWLLGHIYSKRQLEDEALARFRDAERSRAKALSLIPEPLRQSYLSVRGGSSLDTLLEEAVKKRAPVAQEPREARSPGERYGLDGSSPAIRNLLKSMDAVAPGAPWVWIAGPPGSGKKAVAAALHKLHASSGGRSWSLSGAELKKDTLLEFFQAFDKEREEVRRDSPWSPLPDGTRPEPAAGGGPGPPPPGAAIPRFSLILGDIDKLPLDAWRALLARVKEEEAIPDGLRVLAPMTAGPGMDLDTSLGPEGAPVIRVPALSERVEDIGILAAKFLSDAAGGRPREFLPGALRKLEAREWKGNLRELRAFVKAIVAGDAGDSDVITDEIVEATSRNTRRAEPHPA